MSNSPVQLMRLDSLAIDSMESCFIFLAVTAAVDSLPLTNWLAVVKRRVVYGVVLKAMAFIASID